MGSPQNRFSPPTTHDPTECTVSEGNPCPACSDLVALNAEISLLGGAITNIALVKKRRMIEASINEFHDPLFHNLALEIITQIFSCYVDQAMTPFFIGDMESYDKGYSIAPFVLGGVSKSWREAVRATPSLWSSLRFSLRRGTEPPVQLARERLSHSGQLPLCIRVDYILDIRTSPALNLLLDLFREYAHRWRILHLEAIEPSCYAKLFDGLDGAPALEILRLLSPEWQSSDDPPFTLHNTPRLKEVQLTKVRIGKICVQWYTLTHLKVSHLSNEELWSILRLAVGLIKCGVSFVHEDATVPVLTLPSPIFFPLGRARKPWNWYPWWYP